ncbi:MAG: TonB-dependent receptor [Rhodoferax sp.]|nr:TonB-dependent receptor [Rhodoferax sp.]
MAGQSAGYGGVVNVITKAPQARRSAEVSVQLGSDQRRELGLDLGGALGENRRLSGRLIVSGLTEGPNALGLTGGKRDYIAPSLGYSNRAWGTEVVLAYEHNAQSTRNFSQVFYDEAKDTLGSHKRPIRLGDNRTVISDGVETNLSLDVHQRLSEHWRVGLKLLANKADVTLPGARVGLIAPGRYPTVIGVDVRASTVMQKNAIKIDLNGEFSTGPISHKLLWAYDSEQSDIVKRQSFSRASFDAVSGLQLTGLTHDSPLWVQDARPRETGLLLMDQLTWGPWAAMLAVRRIAYQAGNRLIDSDESLVGLLPALGVVYRVQPELSLYASTSRGFLPQGGLLDFATRRPIEPGRAAQAEIGAKLWFGARQGALTAALFSIDESNKAGPDPANPGFFKNTTGVQSKGLDLELSGMLTPRLSARLAYTRLHLDQYREPGVEQNPLLYAAHQVSAWLSYKLSTLAPGAWIGAGINGRSAAAGGQALLSGRELVSPASLRLDLQGGYEQANRSLIYRARAQTEVLCLCMNIGSVRHSFDRHVTGRHQVLPRQAYNTEVAAAIASAFSILSRLRASTVSAMASAKLSAARCAVWSNPASLPVSRSAAVTTKLVAPSICT